MAGLRFPVIRGRGQKSGITRVHLEEEAGKTVHSGTGILDSDYSMQDYNRCGIPFIEIVGEPDLRSPKEAKDYLEKLRTSYYIPVSPTVKWKKDHSRCDANISLAPKGPTEFGVRVEIKNMNSFRAVQAALEAEAKRQAELLDNGDRVEMQTRTWDENNGVTVFMRSKEESSDYRYFPEPDLMPVLTEESRVERLRRRLPELPDSRRKRYIEKWNLPEYDAGLTQR